MTSDNWLAGSNANNPHCVSQARHPVFYFKDAFLSYLKYRVDLIDIFSSRTIPWIQNM
jgi:hypothetical protein